MALHYKIMGRGSHPSIQSPFCQLKPALIDLPAVLDQQAGESCTAGELGVCGIGPLLQHRTLILWALLDADLKTVDLESYRLWSSA